MYLYAIAMLFKTLCVYVCSMGRRGQMSTEVDHKVILILILTVNDGDVSALVVLRQGHGGSLAGGHDAHRAAGVRALQVGLGTEGGAQHPQSVGGEGFLRAVVAVGLVPPLHHRRLAGGGVVLARQDHRLEEHGQLLLLLHGDVHALTHAD